MTKEKTLYKGVCDAKVIDASRVQFLVYNCTVKGTLLVHSIKMTVAGKCYTKAELKKKSSGKKIDPKGKIPLTPLTVKRDFFPAGVYFYVTENSLGKTPAEAEKKFRACMKDIASHHCNTVYISGLSSDPEVLNKYCKIASEYGIKVFAQGNLNDVFSNDSLSRYFGHPTNAEWQGNRFYIGIGEELRMQRSIWE